MLSAKLGRDDQENDEQNPIPELSPSGVTAKIRVIAKTRFDRRKQTHFTMMLPADQQQAQRADYAG